MCLVESIQSFYLHPTRPVLHIVFVDVCVNDFDNPPDEMEMSYIEVASFVRRRGGEVVFVCSWSYQVFRDTQSPKINIDLASDQKVDLADVGIELEGQPSYNRCAAIGIRLAQKYHFPFITYHDPLLLSDGSYSKDSETAFITVLPSLMIGPTNGHPSMFGRDLVAQTFSRWIYWRVCHVLSLPLPLPPPHIPLLNSTTSSLLQLINSGEKFSEIVTSHHGFKWKTESGNKPGWISEKFGSTLEMRLPVGVSSGYLSIGYLQTYTVVGIFNLTVMNQGHLVSNRRVNCAISKHFSQTAFITIPFTVRSGVKVFDIRFEHLDHHDNELRKYDDLHKYFLETKAHRFVETPFTKVKIISVGVYDSAEGLASRPREVDYNAE
jgi:hypothetical protein